MEKLNIAELLKDCPSGMELDSTIVDGLYFYEVTENNTIKCYIKRSYKHTSTCNSICFYSDGSYLNYTNAKCVIFPKGKTTWDGFQRPFKDGDVVYVKTDAHDNIVIYKKLDEHLHRYVNLSDEEIFYCDKIGKVCTKDKIREIRLATEKEKEKLFQAIKERGYKWNAETKELEKLVESKFKVGDRIRHIKSLETFTVIHIYHIDNEFRAYEIQIKEGMTKSLYAKNQDEYELVPVVPKFKVGDKIRHKLTRDVYKILFVLSNGYGGGVYDVAITNEIGKSIDIKEQDEYELLPNKFDISTLVSFESRVLVRDTRGVKWWGAFYSHYDATDSHPFHCIGFGRFKQCIPYEGNEHLLGTINDCDDFYKTWK